MSGNNNNDDYNGVTLMQQNLDDKAQDASVSKGGPSSMPPIFKLTLDCCNEIFEYLSLKDLHSVGQTCKGMQREAGEYFKRNYKHCEKFSHHDGIYSMYFDQEGNYTRTPTIGFNRYIYNISHYYNNSNSDLIYIKSHSNELESVGQIYLVCTCVHVGLTNYFQKILPQIESVRLHQCTGSGDIYDSMLKFCENLKTLIIVDDLGSILKSYKRNNWLCERYPKLEHLQLAPRNAEKIPELCTFFEKNPSVQSFSTTSSFLWMNQDFLLKSNRKLDILCVDFCTNLLSLGEFRDLFNEMHEKGFYKRLHLNVESVNQELSDQIVSLPAIEKFGLNNFNDIYSLHRLTALRELRLPSGLKQTEFEILAKNLVNLEKVTFGSITSNGLLPFMRSSRKLHKVTACLSGGNVLNLPKLNKEREKLLFAKKVIIFLDEKCFIATKWAAHNGDINLNFTEIRHSNSE